MSELKRKTVQVPTPVYPEYQVGEEVDVLLKASMGHKAVWLAYVLPLVVLVAALMISLHAGASELMAGLVCIVAVALYYLLIWLMRGKLSEGYIFAIQKKVNKP